MKIIYFTNRGTRDRNEDSLLINEEVITEINMEEPVEVFLRASKPLCFAVADGIGGRLGGEIASREILKTLNQYKEFFIKSDYKFLLNKFILTLQKFFLENPDLKEMGTTLSCLCLNKNKYSVFHIGDTRIYSWNQKDLDLLTIDHTYVQDLFEKGFIKFQEMSQHPLRGYLKYAITADLDIQKIEYQESTYPYHNQNFFLCSDGVWENISYKKLKQILLKDETLKEKAKKIIEICSKKIIRDNFSFILVENQSNLN